MFGKELKATRIQFGYSQRQVAKGSQISQQNISRWESDKREPTIGMCVKLAEFYGITIDELIGRDFDKTNYKESKNDKNSNRYN